MSKMCWIRLTMLFALLVLSRNLAAQGFTESDKIERKHLDFAGKPCLETKGVSQPLASSPRILNHSVSLKNHCAERIKVKLCYYGTDNCTAVEVPGNSAKDQVIGVFPAMQMFRYDVKEVF